ncbi:MAG: glutamate synthase-related protein [Anaerolineae bacterium]|nr:glutamate synthase-related protein [Anaerolineae bacterium]
MIEIERRSTHQPPQRPRHAIGPWRPAVARTCIDCGLCVSVCPTDVFFFAPGRRRLAAPRAEACLGPDACGVCVPACPADAITIPPNPNWSSLGNAEWTNAMIASTWEAGAHGALSREDPVAIGESGDGFDQMGLIAPEGVPLLIPDEVDLRVPLHHRGRQVWIEFPVIGGAVEAGAVSAPVTLGRAMAARALGILSVAPARALAGRGARYRENLALPLDDRPDGAALADLARAAAITLRYPAAPDLCGLSDLKQRLGWLQILNPGALLIVEVDATSDAPEVAVGVAHAGAHVVHLRRPPAGAPLAYTINPVHRGLQAEGVRDQVAVIASGGVRTPHDALKAVALGADACAIATAALVALGCIPPRDPGGALAGPPGVIADAPSFAALVDPRWVARTTVNLVLAWAAEWRRALAVMGLPDVRALRGRTDLLAVVGQQPA